jgi:PAS domain S-box-containing protein
MRENRLTYEELTKKIKIQEFEIENLSRKEEFLNKFRFFVEQSNDLICEIDSDSLFRKVNPGIAHALGYSKEELIGKSFISFVHPDDLEKSLKQFDSLTHGNTRANFENRLLNGNGEYIIVQWTAIPISSQSIYAIGRDITELRKTQAKLFRSENLLNSAQKSAKIGTWEFNLETKALTWSDGLYAIFEIEKEENQDLFQIYLNHFSQESIDRLQKKIDQLIIDKKTFQIEQSALLIGDKIKWVNETVFPLLDEKGNVFAIRGNTQDISLKKELNDALKDKEEAEIQNKLKQVEEESNKKFKYYIEKAPYGIFVLDEKGQYLDINPSSVNMSGYSKEELLKMKFGDLSLPESKEKVAERFKTLLENGSLKGETQAVRKNGEIVWRFYNIIKISENRYLGFDRDITENKIIEAKIIQNEKRFRAMLENNDAIVSLMDDNKHTIFISSSAERITGWSHNELEKFFNGEYLHPDDQEEMKRVFQEMLLHPGKLFPVSFQAKHKEGHYIWFEGTINNSLNDQHIKGIVTNIRDVTERKKSEEKLNIEREKFVKIAKTSPGLIYSLRQNKDGSFSYPYASDAIEDIYGFNYAAIENDPNKIFSLIHPDDIEKVMTSILETKTKLIPLTGTYRYFHPKKGLVWHEVNSLPEVESEGTVICHGIVTDVTDRILSEQKIIKANRLYLFISQINQMIVRTTDEETLFREACDIAINFGQFKMVWIGLVDSHTKKVVPKMIAGDDRGYFSIIKPISYEDVPEGRGPTGTAFREQKYIYCNDIENDSNMEPWRAEALSRGYLSSMSLPIIKFGKVVGTFSFYAGEKNFFDAEEIALLEEATGDVSYALEVLEKETLRKKAEELVIESEKRYHTLTEVSPVGIFRTDASGKITYVNQRWCEIAGLSKEEALGNGWLSTVHMEDSAHLFEIWQNAIAKKEKIATEYRYHRPDGLVIWVIFQAIPEFNAANELVGYIGTTTNITETKSTGEEIKKLNHKMIAILDAIPDLLFEVGIDGTIYNYHSRQDDLLLFPPAFFIGKKIKTQ